MSSQGSLGNKLSVKDTLWIGLEQLGTADGSSLQSPPSPLLLCRTTIYYYYNYTYRIFNNDKKKII
jgi:hypothetical protein